MADNPAIGPNDKPPLGYNQTFLKADSLVPITQILKSYVYFTPIIQLKLCFVAKLLLLRPLINI